MIKSLEFQLVANPTASGESKSAKITNKIERSSILLFASLAADLTAFTALTTSFTFAVLLVVVVLVCSLVTTAF
jgi:hypothetical protein